MKFLFIPFLILMSFLTAQDSLIQSQKDAIQVYNIDSISGGRFIAQMDSAILGLTIERKKQSCTKKVVRKKQVDFSKLTPAQMCKNQSKIAGYKIQIFYSKDRKAADKVRSQFSKQFPGIFPELVYWQPDYRVLAGDYFNKRSAASDFRKIKKQYPSSLMVKHRIYCRRAK